jgi:hypothetical protein
MMKGKKTHGSRLGKFKGILPETMLLLLRGIIIP